MRGVAHGRGEIANACSTQGHASQDTALTVQWVAIVVVALRQTHAKFMQHTNCRDIAFAGSSAYSITAEAFGDMAAFGSQKVCCPCV